MGSCNSYTYPHSWSDQIPCLDDLNSFSSSSLACSLNYYLCSSTRNFPNLQSESWLKVSNCTEKEIKPPMVVLHVLALPSFLIVLTFWHILSTQPSRHSSLSSHTGRLPFLLFPAFGHCTSPLSLRDSALFTWLSSSAKPQLIGDPRREATLTTKVVPTFPHYFLSQSSPALPSIYQNL